MNVVGLVVFEVIELALFDDSPEFRALAEIFINELVVRPYDVKKLVIVA